MLKVICGAWVTFLKRTHKNLWEKTFRKNIVFLRRGTLTLTSTLTFQKVTYLRAPSLKLTQKLINIQYVISMLQILYICNIYIYIYIYICPIYMNIFMNNSHLCKGELDLWGHFSNLLDLSKFKVI